MFEELMENELGSPVTAEGELRFNCPFCEPNNKHKLYLHTAEDERKGLWHCFRCGEQGNPVSFVMKHFHESFPEALATLEEYDYRPDMENYVPRDDSLTDEEYLLLLLDETSKPRYDSESEVEEEIAYKAPPLPAGYQSLEENTNNSEVIPFLQYLKKRGFTGHDIVKHHIGYVKDCCVSLPSGKSIRLVNHVVFLTYGFNGEYQYWNTRAIGSSFVKSVNAPSKEDEYSKKNVVFNLNNAIEESKIVLTEGVPDSLTVGNAGVATFGKQVTEKQIQLILDHISEEQELYLMLDSDAKKEAVKLGKKLYLNHENTFFVINPYKQDANDMGYEKTWEVIKEHSVRADAAGQIRMML